MQSSIQPQDKKNGRGNLQGIEQTSGDLLLFSSSQHLRAHSNRPQT